MASAWQQELAEVEDRFHQQQEQEPTRTEPAMSPAMTLEQAVAQALPTATPPQLLQRSTAWLHRTVEEEKEEEEEEEEEEEAMRKEKLEHEQAIRQWDQDMQRMQQQRHLHSHLAQY